MIIKFPFPVKQIAVNTIQIIDGDVPFPRIGDLEEQQAKAFMETFHVDGRSIEQALDAAQEAFIIALIPRMIKVEL